MTIEAIIFDIILLLTIIFIALSVGYSLESVVGGLTTFIIGILLLICLVFGQLWYYNNAESGKRAIKSQESNFKGGITREVKVYDVNGKVIQEYKGKFDIDYDDDRIIFDDEKGNRHVIYYPTGTVIVDEIK